MKQTFLLAFLIIAACTAGYSQKISTNTDVIEVKEKAFDFGKIAQGRPVTHNFEIVNKGKSPLILENVQASCGCTTPEWSEAPIAAGAVSVIKVGFNAASEGHFTKNITITYNGGQTKTLMISGDVYGTPTTSAPLNTSLSSLKQINQ